MNRSAIQRKARLAVAGAVGAMLLQACGGGGSQGGTPVLGGTAPSTGGGTIIIGGGNAALQPSSTFAQQCAAGNTEAAPNLRTASLTTEKSWVRSYMDEAYLWREEVPTVDATAAAYSGSDVGVALENYFKALKSTALTSSGKPRDQFSFVMSTREWNALSSGGVALGYGIEWTMASPTPPRNIRVAYVEPGSVAANAGVQRGDTLVTADGTAADAGDSAGVAALNAALYPGALGQNHNFVFTPNGGGSRSVSLASANVTKTPVPTSQVLTGADGARVGYMVFNDHIAPAEAQLISAVRNFSTAGVTDLVVDLRYNGGGYLFIASELAYMIAGSAPTSGKTFEQLRYNSLRSAETNSSDARTPFYNQSCVLVGNNCTSQQPLPALNLKRVFILAQSGTCSASEALINGLRGVDIDVVLIGGTTCGKPYGFTAKDNCGYSYFPIEFVGANNKGFGDYADGFVPAGTGATGVKGCRVTDDLDHALGDTGERMLAAAMQYRLTGSCPVTASEAPRATALGVREAGADAVALSLQKLAARSNRIAGGRH
ncbi:S41 family peptidase [Roseateles chitosanitabidus]|uniref:S41 family peptidase n=1 Tax=Roseateles chitosanitabidus TaxID=65048 RepID=UPI00083064BF|nr:S41 family peptidase [Roseateles chitosanitabidus]